MSDSVGNIPTTTDSKEVAQIRLSEALCGVYRLDANRVQFDVRWNLLCPICSRFGNQLRSVALRERGFLDMFQKVSYDNGYSNLHLVKAVYFVHKTLLRNHYCININAQNFDPKR